MEYFNFNLFKCMERLCAIYKAVKNWKKEEKRDLVEHMHTNTNTDVVAWIKQQVVV